MGDEGGGGREEGGELMDEAKRNEEGAMRETRCSPNSPRRATELVLLLSVCDVTFVVAVVEEWKKVGGARRSEQDEERMGTRRGWGGHEGRREVDE
eukprot:749029-Hanusia_phi.AAC.2